MKKYFASDNNAGICPEAWAALQEANTGHAPGYGDDPWTKDASDRLRELFETDCEVFFVFNGTAANALGLAALCQPYHAIFCHEFAHSQHDECGAPEFFSNGAKVRPIPGAQGRIDLNELEQQVRARQDLHFPKPRALTITQATEVGTVYSVEDLQAVGALAKRLELKLHMDGARFANALAFLRAPPKAVTWQAGVDLLSFGGTKNGTCAGDALVFFDTALAREFEYRCKQAGQLASKMRFLSAPWTAMLRNETWLRHASHANRMATLLAESINRLDGLELMFPCQANSVFVRLPPRVITELHRRGWKFYPFIGDDGCRLMCAWDTTEEEVREFVNDLKELLET